MDGVTYSAFRLCPLNNSFVSALCIYTRSAYRLLILCAQPFSDTGGRCAGDSFTLEVAYVQWQHCPNLHVE